VVEYVLFCTFYSDGQWNLSPMNAKNNVNGIGAVDRGAVWTDAALLDVQEKFVRKAVSELKGFDNVYFELANEPYFENAPVLGHPWNDRMAKAIRETSAAHMVALNVANGSQKVDKVPEGVSMLNFHYCSPPDAVEQNRDLRLPIAFDESGFRGSGPDPYRREAWEFMMAGGSVYNGLDWTFTVASPQGQDRTGDPNLGLTDPALRSQLSILKRFMDRLTLERMQPMAGVRGLVQPERQWAAYLGDSGELRLDLPAGDYRVEWTSTLDGKTQTSSLKHKNGEAVLASPFVEAAVVVSRVPSN
jgi:hypothetical protein